MMMGGSRPGPGLISPNSANPRSFGDDETERERGGLLEDVESYGRVTLVEVKNTPNVLRLHHSLSKENLQGAPPGGSGISSSIGVASRKTSLTEFDTELLASQFAKKEKLRNIVQTKHAELAHLRREVQLLRKQLEPILWIKKLEEENERLQKTCNDLTSEVDSYTDGAVPLGETSAEFYRERSPRQDTSPFLQNNSQLSTSGGIFPTSRSPVGRLPTGSHQVSTSTYRKVPPPRPPPPNSLLIPWECSKCTFRNHPDLNLCEQCEMIRVIPQFASPTISTAPHPQGQAIPHYYPLPRNSS